MKLELSDDKLYIALNATSELAPTSQNYTQALELLEKRFGNAQLIMP